MRHLGIKIICASLALTLAACGSDTQSKGVDILDPVVPHYGKTYAEWAAEWVSSVHRVSPPDCASPFLDTTGAGCTSYQDLDSPVFFLVGNFGGVSRRSDCAVPTGKALFFPILMVWGDNAGVPADMIATDADLKSYAESTFDTVDRASLRVLVDGQAVSGLDRGGIRSAPYGVHLEAGKNPYACMGINDVEGDFAGYLSGYWAMLAPLPAGHHSVEFGGHVTSTTPSNDVTLDISYTFKID